VIIPITKDALTLNPQASEEDASVMKKNRPAPMARPKLSSEITSGPIMQSTASANKFGAIALDASFSEFGEYEQQFYSALQVGWYNEVAFYKPLDTGTQVSISFILKSDGSIDSVTVLSSTAGLIATSICESAITKRSPFRPWTQDMIQVFGDQKELKVRFYYR
jgi:membrane protein involved in colicin uptake